MLVCRRLAICVLFVSVFFNNWAFADDRITDKLLHAAYCQGVLAQFLQVTGQDQSNATFKDRFERHWEYVNAHTFNEPAVMNAAFSMTTKGMSDFTTMSRDQKYAKAWSNMGQQCLKKCTQKDCLAKCTEQNLRKLESDFPSYASVKRCLSGPDDLPF